MLLHRGGSVQERPADLSRGETVMGGVGSVPELVGGRCG